MTPEQLARLEALENALTTEKNIISVTSQVTAADYARIQTLTDEMNKIWNNNGAPGDPTVPNMVGMDAAIKSLYNNSGNPDADVSNAEGNYRKAVAAQTTANDAQGAAGIAQSTAATANGKIKRMWKYVAGVAAGVVLLGAVEVADLCTSRGTDPGSGYPVPVGKSLRQNKIWSEKDSDGKILRYFIEAEELDGIKTTGRAYQLRIRNPDTSKYGTGKSLMFGDDALPGTYKVKGSRNCWDVPDEFIESTTRSGI